MWKKNPKNKLIMKVVLDSSVFNKLFLMEDDRDKALKCLEDLNENDFEILVPSIFQYEVLGVAGYYKLDLNEVYDLIRSYEESVMRVISPSCDMVKMAIKITNSKAKSFSGYPSFYDSIYHALAIANNCDFLTADNKHYQKTKDIGNIKLLSEWR